MSQTGFNDEQAAYQAGYANPMGSAPKWARRHDLYLCWERGRDSARRKLGLADNVQANNSDRPA